MSKFKLESARRQLGTALALYLADQDPVSVHCLAGGGCELIEHAVKKAGATPFSSFMLQSRPDLKQSDLRRIQRQYWNAFKHATHQHSGKEREDDDLLSQFTDVQNDHVLLIGWYDYANVVHQMPVEAQAHQAWYFVLYPDKLEAKHPIARYQEIFPDLVSKPREEQKRMLNKAIVDARSDERIMGDPRTEHRGLLLGWP